MILCRPFDMSTPNTENLIEEDTLQLYAVLNMWEPPRRLSQFVGDEEIGKADAEKRFLCHFQLPLPKQVVIFGLGNWEAVLKGYEIIAEVTIDTNLPSQKIGVLTSRKKVLCWQEAWTEKFMEKSEEIVEQGRMAKLTLKAVKECFKADKENDKYHGRSVLSSQQTTDDLQSPCTPGNFKNLRQKKLSFAECDEFESCSASEKITPPPKKRRKCKTETPVLQGQRKHSMKDYGSACRMKGSPRINTAKSPKIPTPPDTPASCNVSEEAPSGRWGHDMCLIKEGKAVLVGGQGSKLQMAKDSVWTIDVSQGKNTWHQESSEGGGAGRRIGHTIAYDPDKNQLYVYGGSKNKRWFSDVNVLDLKTNVWSAVKAVGSAPTRAYHTCNFFHGELLVFGGVYPNPDPQPDSCSNELYIFNTDAKNWYKPITSGASPSPKSGHSASLLGDRLVVFGGWDFPQCFNDVCIIDLALMEFSSPSTTGVSPSPRSWHASTVLPRQRIFIHGGYDGSEILTDSFIFELGILTWTQIQTPNSITPRAGHVALYLPTDEENKQQDVNLAIFGGGDNAGGFFNDFIIFSTC